MLVRNKELPIFGQRFINFVNSIALPEITGLDKKNQKFQIFDLHDGFAKAVEMVYDHALIFEAKMIFIGNGGSAAIASHRAVDFLNNLGIQTVTFSEASLLTCMANDFGYENVFVKPLWTVAREGDILVAISSSGRSPNILNAVNVARKRGCFIITMSGFKPDNPLRQMGNVNFYVASEDYILIEASHALYWDFMLKMLIEIKNLESGHLVLKK